jgi:hypothetical protein
LQQVKEPEINSFAKLGEQFAHVSSCALQSPSQSINGEYRLMSSCIQLHPNRPELRTSTLQIDVTDKSYRALADFGRRLAVLLNGTTVRSDRNAVGSLDDLLGAVYSLILARHYYFINRTDQTIDIEVVLTRAQQIQRGEVRTDGKWIAGWHFNSALYRIAAVYHRLLKVVWGQPATHDNIPTLRPKIEDLYRQWTKIDWSSSCVHAIHTQVNTLKHTPKGIYSSRTATFEDAITSIDELLNLVEAWSDNAP